MPGEDYRAAGDKMQGSRAILGKMNSSKRNGNPVNWILGAFLSSTLLSSQVAAVPLSALKELEIKAWTAEESELHKVEQELVKVMQREPDSTYVHHLLSHLMVRIYSKNPGDMYILKQASDLAQQAIDLDPNFSGGYASYAHLLDLMGNTDGALKLMKDAEGAGIEANWRFYLTRARLTADDSPTERTLNLLKTAISFTDTQPDVIVPYIIAVINTQKTPDTIIASLEDWNQKYPHNLFALSLGVAYTENKEYKKAESAYASILKTNPNHLEASVNLAVLQYRHLNLASKAVSSLETILSARKTKDITTDMVRLHLGAAHLKTKKFDLAKSEFLETVAGDPANVGVIDFVANSYRTENAHKELAGFLNSVTRDVAGSGIYYALMGETLSEKLGQHSDAIKAFKNAIILDPSRSDYYNGLGLAVYREKNYDDALKIFVKATEIDPSDATARYNEACMLALLGNSEEAINSLAEAITLDPRLLRSAANDEDFSNLRGNIKFRNLMVGQEAPEDKIGH